METSSDTKSYPTASITRAAAAALVQAARMSAAAIRIEAAVAVTDSAGNLVAFERTDGAPFLTNEVAINKAWTAASYNQATHIWNAYLTNDPAAAPLANIPRLMPVGGGNPVRENGMLIGAIGISGGTALQDQQIAEAALKAVGFDRE